MNGFGPANPWNSTQYGLPTPQSFLPNVPHVLGGNSASANAANPFLFPLPAPQLGHVGAMVERYEQQFQQQLQQATRVALGLTSNTAQPSNSAQPLNDVLSSSVPTSRTKKQLQEENADLTERLKQAEKKLAEKNSSRKLTRLQNEKKELSLRLTRAEKRIASLKELRLENKTLSHRNAELSERVAELEKDRSDAESLLETVCKENEDLLSEIISSQRAQQQMNVQQYELVDQTIIISQAPPSQMLCKQPQPQQKVDFSVQSHATVQQTPHVIMQSYPAVSALESHSNPSPAKSISARHLEGVIGMQHGTDVSLQSRDNDNVMNDGHVLGEFFVNHPFQPSANDPVQNVGNCVQSKHHPCGNCGATVSSQWRNGRNGRSQCAACHKHYPSRGGRKRTSKVKLQNDCRRSDSPRLQGPCSNCTTTKTSMWHVGEDGDVECNPCNLYHPKNGQRRPVPLHQFQLKRRNLRED